MADANDVSARIDQLAQIENPVSPPHGNRANSPPPADPPAEEYQRRPAVAPRNRRNSNDSDRGSPGDVERDLENFNRRRRNANNMIQLLVSQLKVRYLAEIERIRHTPSADIERDLEHLDRWRRGKAVNMIRQVASQLSDRYLTDIERLRHTSVAAELPRPDIYKFELAVELFCQFFTD